MTHLFQSNTLSTGATRNSVSSSTRSRVFQRDGGECWLCGHGPAGILAVVHQIAAANIDEVGDVIISSSSGVLTA